MGPESADVVCFAGQDWWYHNRGHSDVQFMMRLSANRRVLFINGIGMRFPSSANSTDVLKRLRRKVRSVLKYMRRPLAGNANFIVFTPIAVPVYSSRFLRFLNGALIGLQTRFVMSALGIQRPQVFATLPTAVDALGWIPREALVYNRSDKHSGFAEGRADVLMELEERMMTEADLVVYSSRSLLAQEAALTGSKSAFVDHGVDTELFWPGARPRPRDFPARSGRKVAGFFGALDGAVVDFALLAEVVRSMPDVDFVLIGSTDQDLRALSALENCHLIPKMPQEQIPQYAAFFDVGIMPWLDTEWIRRSNPIKLKEYLAMGLAVVSTPIDEAVEYSPHVLIADGPAEFVAALRTVLRDGQPDERKSRHEAVAGCSWMAQTARLDELLDQVSPSSRPRRRRR